MSAAYYGGDIGSAFLRGAGLGAIGGAAFGAIGIPKELWQVGAYGVTGGGLATLAGGKFEEGAIIATALAFSAYGYNKIFNMPPDGRVASKDADLGREQTTKYYLDTKNTEHALFGKAGCETIGCESNPTMQWVAKNVYFVNQGSILHDLMVDILPKVFRGIVLAPTIPPAIALTLAGATAVYAPVAAPVALSIRDDKQ
jgi:hypothetical protein